jgi:superfamily II DNA/RNA helicase
MKLKEMGIEVPKTLQIRDKPVGDDNGENEKTSI